MEKRYSMLQGMYLSFHSADLYRDVRKNWTGTGFLYLLALLAITWLPMMIAFHLMISAAVRQIAPKYIEQVPKITIQRGEVSIDRPVPYAITDPDSNAPLMVFDTSGKITSFDQTPAYALLTKNKFLYRKPSSAEIRIYELSRIDVLTVDRDMVNTWVEAFRKYFATVAYPFAVLGTFLFRVLQLLLYAALGMVMVNKLKAQLDYLTVLRLASIAITPAVLFSTLITLTRMHVPGAWLLNFAIAMGYLYFAVKVNAEPAEPEAPAA